MASTLFSVSNRVALVSGASSGIGAYIAKGLAEHGCTRVYMVGRRETALKTLASVSPSILIPIVGDVSTKAGCVQIAETFTKLEKQAGVKEGEIGLDILVNNAGVMKLEGMWDENAASVEEVKDALLKLDDGDWAHELAINVASFQWLSAALLPYLVHSSKHNNGFREGRGCIINNTSVSALYVSRADKGHLYAASKTAAESLSKNLASKFTKMGVRVNSIAPANIPSEMNDPKSEDSFISKLRNIIPIGRTGNEEDAVGAIVYLASRAGSYVSGTCIILDGGILVGV
ncbi:NAD(P)-binding protein [Heliocybe sulcata]|uniref:NAD(P)-binding protein n=1 Tax=Heliocybe sulcata TaxID=5364 RepID=A0A5C3N9B2_9AGAM|nr:NAD(P)-binding protein [Heliocybe sulcata]